MVAAVARVRGSLRCGFSTGTAATASARAALRQLLAGRTAACLAVRLPSGIFFPVSIGEAYLTGQGAVATVIKDGGDDPDVTHGAVIRAKVRCWSSGAAEGSSTGGSNCLSGILLVAGEGVGVVTRPGLPIAIGEPAVNPVPRRMLAENLTEELLLWDAVEGISRGGVNPSTPPRKAAVHLPFARSADRLERLLVELEIEVPRGQEMARRTLNPRLGVMGGISILGTTGLVKPFSHDAYRETIQAALSVAASMGCRSILLSTGGKSERLARQLFPAWPDEAFVQIADFFAFALEEGRQRSFREVVLSVFFGKALKMAQGHPYTHAHTVPLDLKPLARQAEAAGYARALSCQLEQANTAREALDMLLANRAEDLIRVVGRDVLKQAAKIVGERVAVRVLIFGYGGNLLLDLEGP